MQENYVREQVAKQFDAQIGKKALALEEMRAIRRHSRRETLPPRVARRSSQRIAGSLFEHNAQHSKMLCHLSIFCHSLEGQMLYAGHLNVAPRTRWRALVSSDP